MSQANLNNKINNLNWAFTKILGFTSNLHLVNFSVQVIDFSLYQMTPADLKMTGIALDNDLDGIIYTRNNIDTDPQIHFIELNKLGCHTDCDGCFQPQDELQCLRCKDGLRLVEGRCISKLTPCPLKMKENALGECQSCDKNDPSKTNCKSCELSFDNNCIACGEFSNPNINFAPACGCAGYDSLAQVNGKNACKSTKCSSIVDCYECDITDRCIACAQDNSVIINNGATCQTVSCPLGSYPSFTYFRESAFCLPCPQDCLQCINSSICLLCQLGTHNFGGGFCKKINFPLKFNVENSYDSKILKNASALIDVTISQSDGANLELNYLLNHAGNYDYRLFTFLPEDAVIEAKSKLFNENTIRISLKIADKYAGQKLTLKVQKDLTKATQQIQLEDGEKEIDITLPASFNEKEIQTARSAGNIIGQFNKFTGGAADYASFGLVVFGYDPSGHVLKFSQMIKILSRFRFLLIQFGLLLGIFFKASAIKYDPESIQSERYLLDHNQGYQGKFSLEKASLTIFEKEMISVVIYLVTWILKSQTYVILNIANDTLKITRSQCYFVNITQKIHFVAFNKITIDMIFFGFRTISHTKKLSFNEICLTVVLLLLVIFDICEIWKMSSSVIITEDYFDVFEIKYKNNTTLTIDKSEEKSSNILNDQNSKDEIKQDWTDQKFLKNRKQVLADTPIDQAKMIKKLAENPTIQLFCTNDLKKEQKFTKNTAILVSNYAFILRIAIIHIILVGLPFMPIFQLILLILLEILYFTFSSGYYLKKKHIRSLIFLLPRVWQSLYLFTIELVLLVFFLGFDNRKTDSYGKTTQKFIVGLITIGTFAEYIILSVNLSFILYRILVEKKVLKNDSIASEKLIKSQEFFIYLDQNTINCQKDETQVSDNFPQKSNLEKIVIHLDDIQEDIPHINRYEQSMMLPINEDASHQSLEKNFQQDQPEVQKKLPKKKKKIFYKKKINAEINEDEILKKEKRRVKKKKKKVMNDDVHGEQEQHFKMSVNKNYYNYNNDESWVGVDDFSKNKLE